MRLYRTATGRWVGTQDDARVDGRGWVQVDVPDAKGERLAWLNDNWPSWTEHESPAFQLGRSDAERGMTTNPYASSDLREQWEAGHAFAVESGMASLSSFASRAAPRNGKRR